MEKSSFIIVGLTNLLVYDLYSSGLTSIAIGMQLILRITCMETEEVFAVRQKKVSGWKHLVH